MRASSIIARVTGTARPYPGLDATDVGNGVVQSPIQPRPPYTHKRSLLTESQYDSYPSEA